MDQTQSDQNNTLNIWSNQRVLSQKEVDHGKQWHYTSTPSKANSSRTKSPKAWKTRDGQREANTTVTTSPEANHVTIPRKADNANRRPKARHTGVVIATHDADAAAAFHLDGIVAPSPELSCLLPARRIPWRGPAETYKGHYRSWWNMDRTVSAGVHNNRRNKIMIRDRTTAYMPTICSCETLFMSP